MSEVEHAVELALDDAATSAVAALCAALEGAGIDPVTSSSPHAHPHVSLAVVSGTPPDELAAVLDGLGAALPALTLSSVGVFATAASVLFLGVAPTEPLLALHRAAYEHLDAAGVAHRHLYRPGTWVPHCTLAMHVVDLAAAVRAVAVPPSPLPLTAAVTALRVVEVPTGKVRATVR